MRKSAFSSIEMGVPTETETQKSNTLADTAD